MTNTKTNTFYVIGNAQKNKYLHAKYHPKELVFSDDIENALTWNTTVGPTDALIVFPELKGLVVFEIKETINTTLTIEEYLHNE